MALDKENYGKNMMNIGTRLAKLKADIEEVNKVWDAHAYGSGGGNEITDLDLTNLPIDAAILQNMNYSFVHVIKFLINDAPANSDHWSNVIKGINVDGEQYSIVLPEGA